MPDPQPTPAWKVTAWRCYHGEVWRQAPNGRWRTDKPNPINAVGYASLDELRGVHGGEFDPAEVDDQPALLAALEEARRERDLAIAHDRQPYPTADAYEQACRALERHRWRADAAEEGRDAAHAEVEQLRQRLDLAEGRIDGDAWDRLTKRAEDAERLLLDIGEAISPTGEWPWEAIEQLPEAVRGVDARAMSAEAAIERVRAVAEKWRDQSPPWIKHVGWRVLAALDSSAYESQEGTG